MSRNAWIGLGAWLLLCYGAAAFAGHFTVGEWYGQLAKPLWTPPDVVFAPVWTVLYGMMAVAGWLMWTHRRISSGQAARNLFALQLVLNVAWSWLFFGLERPGLALVDVVLLAVAVAATVTAFWRVHRLSGVLLLPYLAWVLFAGALNFGIWRLNR